MAAGRVWAAVAAATGAVLLTGCGGGSGHHGPAANVLPLVPGARVIAQATQCDKGANAFCATELVVVDTKYRNSLALLNAEHVFIHARGWRGVTGDSGGERAAESPGRAVRVTYGTNDGDLRGVDLGWLHRSRVIARALAETLFSHTPAMSVLLETGSA